MLFHYFQVQMKIICEGEVIIKPMPCQHTYKHISVQSYTYCSWRNGENDEELTKETSDHPPLSLHRGWEAHQRPLLTGIVTSSGHLLPPLHSIGLIVFLFIYFTIDFSVEADMALIHSDWLSWCDGWNKASKQTQCKTSVTRLCVSVWVIACVCLFRCASVFVCVFALASLSKYVCEQICNTVWPCVYVCVYLCTYVCVRVCVCAYTWRACGGCWRKKARGRTMCHNYALGVTVKTALKPDEVVFTNMNRQIEHHIGVRYPPLSLYLTHTQTQRHTHVHTPLSPSLVAALPLSVTSCVYLWVCASTVNVCSVCPISSPCFRYDGGGANEKKSRNRSRPGKKVSVLLIKEGRKSGT